MSDSLDPSRNENLNSGYPETSIFDASALSAVDRLVMHGGLFTSSSPYAQAESLLALLGVVTSAPAFSSLPESSSSFDQTDRFRKTDGAKDSPMQSQAAMTYEDNSLASCKAVFSNSLARAVSLSEIRGIVTSSGRVPPVFMEYSAYHVVVFVDIDSSMFRVAKDGSIPFDTAIQTMEESIFELSSRGRSSNARVFISICLQYMERGIMKTLFEAEITSPDFEKNRLAKVKKALLRNVYRSTTQHSQLGKFWGGDSGFESSFHNSSVQECGSLEYVIEYSKPHFDLIVTNACPAILLISGAANKTVNATQALKSLVIDRIALTIAVVETSSCYIADEASLRLVSEHSGGAYIASQNGPQSIVQSLFERPLLQSRGKLFELCAPRLSSRQLLAYKINSSATAHVVAERWGDGFVASHASCADDGEPGKRASRTSRIEMSFYLPFSKMTYIAYKLTFTITKSSSENKSILSKSQGKKSVGNKLSNLSSKVTNSQAKSKSLPSAAFTDQSLSALNIEISSVSPRDWSINATNAVYDKHLDFAGLLMDRDFAHLETLLRIQGICDHQSKVLDGRHLSNSDLKSLAFRRVDSGDKLNERQDAASAAAQFPFLLSSVAALARQNVLFIDYLYIRNQAILANLNESGRFRYAAVSLILKSLDVTCETYEISNTIWVVIPRNTSTTANQERSQRYDAYVLSLRHLNGVFLQIKLSRIQCQLGPIRILHVKKDVIVAAVQAALQTLHMEASLLNRNIMQFYISDLTTDSLSRLVIMGKVSGFLSEYSLDLSDNFTLGSLVSELCAAKTNAGFQMASHVGGQMVDVSMCASFPCLIGGEQKDALIQCAVRADSSGVSIVYYLETQLVIRRSWSGMNSSNEGHKRMSIMSLVAELRKQDEVVMTLYSALITSLMNCPFSDGKHVGSAESFSLDSTKWESLRTHSSPWTVELPGFAISDPKLSYEINGRLLDLLAETLVRCDRFQRIHVIGLQDRLNLICHRVDHEHILFVEFSNEDLSAGKIDFALGKDDDKVVFSSKFEACLKARFRLFQVPVLRSFVDDSLYAVCSLFGLACVDPSRANLLQSPEGLADAAEAPRAERASLPFNLAKRVKLLGDLRNLMLKRHVFNYMHFLYDNVVNQTLTPKPSEISLAIDFATSLSHELDISTLCRARRNTNVLSYDLVVNSLIQSFNNSIGRFLMPIPGADFFAYRSSYDSGNDAISAPIFVKFSYIMISSQSSAPLSLDTASLLRRKDVLDSSMNSKEDSSVCLLDTPELDSSAADLSIARSIYKLIQGEFPEGVTTFDSSTDIVIRVEFFFPFDEKNQISAQHYFNSFSTSLNVFKEVIQNLASELDVFVAFDILNSLAISPKTTTETIILAQRCLSTVPSVVTETMSMDVLAPISLRSQSSLPETALNRIMRVFESEMAQLLSASKIGDMFYLRRWDFDAANAYSAQSDVSGTTSAWILVSLASFETSTRSGAADAAPVMKLEFSVTLRLLGQHRDHIVSMQQKAIAQFVKYLEVVNKSINQWVLLYDLFHTHMASAYLIPTVRSEKSDAASSSPGAGSLASRSGIPPPRARARPPVPTVDSIALKLAASKKEKEGDDKSINSGEAIGPKKIVVTESSLFQPGCFQCCVRGTVTCKVYFASNLNLEMAIRHLEKMAFDPFVIMNAAHQYVYRNQKGEVYYMSFQQVKKDDTTISLDIYGCAPVSNEMLEQLRKLLESKLAEYTAGLISEEIASTASSSSRVALKSGDIKFLQSSGQSRSLAVRVELPQYVSDPIFFLSLVRQLIVSTPLFLNCAEIKDSAEISRDLSTSIHPSCFGYIFLKKDNSTAASTDQFLLGARSRSESVDPSDYPHLSSGSFQFRKLEKISSGVGDRPMLQRKTRVEAEINDSNAVNPVFFQRKRADQTPRCETRFNESVTLWRPEDYRFVYNNSAIAGRGARGEAKQFGVGLALIELQLVDKESDGVLAKRSMMDELMNVGVKSVLFDDVTSLHQALKDSKSPGLLYLDELQSTDASAVPIRTPHSISHEKRFGPSSSVVVPKSPRELPSLHQTQVPILRLHDSSTLRIDSASQIETSASWDSPMVASNAKKKFEVKLSIAPSSDMNRSALMKHCRKCLDDALVLYIGERLLACGQLEAPNDVKALSPASIHPDFKRFEDILRCLHDILYRYPVSGENITSSFGCFRKVTALSRNSAMKLQEMVVDMVLTEFPHLKDMKWNFNISPILSRYVPIEGRFQSGIEPKWACIKRRGHMELFSSMVMGNLFPVYNSDKASSKIGAFLPASTPKTPAPLSSVTSATKSVSISQPNTPSLKLPQQKFATALLNKLGPQALSLQSQHSSTDALSSHSIPLQLLNDDELISSTPQSDACAPLWLRHRRSMIEISISAEGFYLFYFNINPKFAAKVQSCVTGFLESLSERVEARGQEILLKLGIADAYIREEDLVQQTAAPSNVIADPSLNSKEVTQAVLLKFKEIMEGFSHFSWAKSIVRKLFIPIPETNGLLLNRSKSSKDIWSQPSLWTCGFLDFCIEFPLPIREKTLKTSDQETQLSGSFEEYCGSIDLFIRNNKDSSYDVAGSICAGAIFILSILPSSYSTSEQIVSITEVRKMPHDVVSIIHRLCNTESILLEAFKYSIESALAGSGMRMTVPEVLAGMSRQGILAAPEFSFLRSSSSTILPTAILSSRDHRSIKQLHQALFFEIAGSMYRTDQNLAEVSSRRLAQSDHRLLHVMRVAKQFLSRTSSSAEILIPVDMVIAPEHQKVLGDVSGKASLFVCAVLHLLRRGCSERNMDDVDTSHVVNYRVIPSLSQSVQSSVVCDRPVSGVQVNISQSQVDAGAEIMSQIVGNALLHADSSSAQFRLDVLLFDLVNITSCVDQNVSRDFDDRTIELVRNTDDSKSLYYSIANHVISSLRNASGLLLMKLMWMQLCGIALPPSLSGLINSMEVNYLLSQSYMLQLHFLDHFSDGLSSLAPSNDFALLVTALQASFFDRCIVYSMKNEEGQGILIPFVVDSSSTSVQPLAAVVVEITRDPSRCGIFLAEFMPFLENSCADVESRNLEAFIARVSDIILTVFIAASPPRLRL